MPRESSLELVDLDLPEVIAKTAEFLWYFSEKNITGDPAKDLDDDDTGRFIEMAEHLLVHQGIVKEGWFDE